MENKIPVQILDYLNEELTNSNINYTLSADAPLWYELYQNVYNYFVNTWKQIKNTPETITIFRFWTTGEEQCYHTFFEVSFQDEPLKHIFTPPQKEEERLFFSFNSFIDKCLANNDPLVLELVTQNSYRTLRMLFFIVVLGAGICTVEKEASFLETPTADEFLFIYHVHNHERASVIHYNSQERKREKITPALLDNKVINRATTYSNTTYFIFKAFHKAPYYTVDYDSHDEKFRHKSYRVGTGKPMGEFYPTNLIATVEAHGKSCILPDGIYDLYPIGSGKVKRILEEHSGANIEFLPLSIVSKKGKLLSPDYYFLNVLDHQDCIDMEKSEVEDLSPFPDRLSGLFNLHIHQDKIPADSKLFRLKTMPSAILIRGDLREQLEKEGCTGIQYIAIGEECAIY